MEILQFFAGEILPFSWSIQCLHVWLSARRTIFPPPPPWSYSRRSIIRTFNNPNLAITWTNGCKAIILISTHLQFDNLNRLIIRTQVWQCKCSDCRASTAFPFQGIKFASISSVLLAVWKTTVNTHTHFFHIKLSHFIPSFCPMHSILSKKLRLLMSTLIAENQTND